MWNELSALFSPGDNPQVDYPAPLQLGNLVKTGAQAPPDPETTDMALIGLPEARQAGDVGAGCEAAPAAIRQQLYRLFTPIKSIKLHDLGNLTPGQAVADSYALLGALISELLDKRILPLILGGSHDLTYGQYLGYKNPDAAINITVVDEKIDLQAFDEHIDAGSFLLKIFMDQPGQIAHYSHLGYQKYLTDPLATDTLERLKFDALRLGDLQEQLPEAELTLRDTDLLSVDISALRHTDAPGQGQPSPNGFYGEEACRLMRYAGMSDRLSSLGIYGLNTTHDQRCQTAQLAAQMIWHFIEGFYQRHHDYPMTDNNAYYRYTVPLEESGESLIFRKSKKSGRWWLEMSMQKAGVRKKHLIPCTYDDYVQAVEKTLPDRWIKAVEKWG